ncbi:MAG: hypothetical protein K6B14_06020 [Lachnospiraceae bacterium]|nr:hypothetical protein [Lachnospiraceae bacterium]
MSYDRNLTQVLGEETKKKEVNQPLYEEEQKTKTISRSEVITGLIHQVYNKEGEATLTRRSILEANALKSSWLNQALSTKEEQNAQIGAAYGEMYNNKTLSTSQKYKRRKKFAKKAQMQETIIRTIQQYEDDREDLFVDTATGIADWDREFLTKDKKALKETSGQMTEVVKDMLPMMIYLKQGVDEKLAGKLKKSPYYRDFSNETIMDMVRMDKQKQIENLYSDFSTANTADSTATYEKYLRLIDEIDISMFDYQSDEEFVQKLWDNYPLLRAMDHGRMMLDRVLADKRYKLENREALIAKINVIDEIKKDYDSRLKMMQSPYYVSLASKDLANLSEEKLKEMRADEAAKEAPSQEKLAYIDALIERKAPGRFKRGVSAEMLFREELAVVQKQEHEDVMQKYNDLCKKLKTFAKGRDEENYRIDFSRSLSRTMLAYYKQEADKKVKDLDHESIRSHILTRVGDGIGFGEEEIQKVNDWDEDILRTGEFNGTPVPKEVLAKMGEYQDSIILSQTALERANQAYLLQTEAVDIVRAYWRDEEIEKYGIIKNPYFTEEDQKKLKLLDEALAMADKELEDNLQEASGDYFALQAKMAKLRINNGIVFGNEKEGRQKDKNWQQLDEAVQKGELQLPVKCGGTTYDISKYTYAFYLVTQEDGWPFDTTIFMMPGTFTAEPKVEQKEGMTQTEATLRARENADAAYKAMTDAMKEFDGMMKFSVETERDWTGVTQLEFTVYKEILKEKLLPLLKAFLSSVEIKYKKDVQ